MCVYLACTNARAQSVQNSARHAQYAERQQPAGKQFSMQVLRVQLTTFLRMPVINVDYRVAESELGFGLQALRDFLMENPQVIPLPQ
jgi:hypothetical protein